MKLFSLSLFFLSAVSLAGQSLYRDAQALVQCVEVLKATNSPDDPETARATGRLMAILRHYDEPFRADSMVAGSWEELKERYQENALIKRMLADSLVVVPAESEVAVTQAARVFMQTMQTGSRQGILDKMYTESSVSPADYLSVPNLLEKYRAPVFPPMEALQVAAESSNRNVRNGLVSPQAALLEGLAQFILNKAKDEMVINFLDGLLKEQMPNFPQLFPTVLSEFGKADFSYSTSFMGRLRQALYEDMQKMSLRLPMLLLDDDFFEPIQSDPVAYNLLAVYALINQVQLGMPVETALPATNHFLYRNYAEKTKEVNLLLADTAGASPEFQALTVASEAAVNRIENLYLALNKAESALLDLLDSLSGTFPNAPKVADYLDKPAYNLVTLFGRGHEFSLDLLPQLLRGALDSAYMSQYNTLESYDKFFATERLPQQWRAAGLELAQKLGGAWYHDKSIAYVLYNWQRDLTRFQGAIDRWLEESDPTGALVRAQQKFETDRSALRTAVEQDKAFWAQTTRLSQEKRLAFNALSNLLSDNVFENMDFLVDLEAVDNPRIAGREGAVKLERKRAHLAAVEQRLVSLDTGLYVLNPTVFRVSPLKKHLLDKKTVAPYAYMLGEIEDLETAIGSMQRWIDSLERKYALMPSKARNNAEPILQTTELASNLMYCLRGDDPKQPWLTREQLDTLMDGGPREAAFFGLMQQRLGRTNGIGPLSPGGLADFAQFTLKDIALLQSFRQPDSLAEKDSLAVFRKAAFAVNTLNRMLELPLVPDREKKGQYVPLKSRAETLKWVPAVADGALQLMYYLDIKDHTQAIGSLIRLFTNLRNSSNAVQRKDGKSESSILFLQKNGDFIAGVVDAKQENQVQSLLRQMAEPPGGSRIKRKFPLTVGLNAYLGGTFGRETWLGDNLANREIFYSLAPTMPVGIALSTLVGGKHKESFSLFVSFADLGAMLAYQPASVNSAQSEFTFKNIFKPSAQLHWNIRRTPFYTGLGWQYGPQFVKIGNDQAPVGASRFFVAVGVDAPIRVLYRR